jgi:hypothetical protein
MPSSEREGRGKTPSPPEKCVIRKRCAFCGASPVEMEHTVLAGAGSSPLTQESWFPTSLVRVATIRCLSSCKSLTFGLIIGFRLGDDGVATGNFVLLPETIALRLMPDQAVAS